MTTNAQPEEQEAQVNKEKRGKVLRVLFFLYALLFWTLFLFLMVMYLFIGDRSSFGEMVTIWPPLLWVFGLVPLCLIFLLLGRHRYFVFSLVGIVLFLLLTEEWRSLLRFSGHRQRTSSEALRLNPNGSSKIPIRIVTWNVDSADSGKILTILETYEPDVCFLQETPDGQSSIQPADLRGYWEGFHWIDSGDCGVLSRYAIQEIASERIGPWSAPQMLVMELPDGREVLLVNVRLMLPALQFNVFSRKARERFSEAHGERVNQYRRLSELIARTGQRRVILAGDFNVSARAFSLEPLRKILRDAWLECGRGWGRTITAKFPVSRVDQCWVSETIDCTYGRVFRESSPSSAVKKMEYLIALELHFQKAESRHYIS